MNTTNIKAGMWIIPRTNQNVIFDKCVCEITGVEQNQTFRNIVNITYRTPQGPLRKISDAGIHMLFETKEGAEKVLNQYLDMLKIKTENRNTERKLHDELLAVVHANSYHGK